MKRRRPEIVGDEMQKVISTIIATRLKDPRVPFMTSVTGVKMSPDLAHATVFISVYGDEKTKKDAMDALEHAKGFIRYEAVQEIKLRIADASQHTSFENKPYFENLGKLIALYEDYTSNSQKLDLCNNAVDEFDARTDVYAVAFSGPDFRAKTEAERKELMSKSYPYQIKKKKIEEEFAALRKTIIGMRSDSVLAK